MKIKQWDLCTMMDWGEAETNPFEYYSGITLQVLKK
jgi:hypothetical protein